MKIWRLIVHHDNPEQAIGWCKKTSRIAMGWGHVGDLRLSCPPDAPAITSMVRDAYAELDNAHLGGPSLWRFYHEMSIGDLVILSDGRSRRVVMRVTGPYEWTQNSLPAPGDYYHQRSAELSDEDPNGLWEHCGREAQGENIRWTLLRCNDAGGP